MNYFDHAATTAIYPEVLDLLNKSFKEDFANPNSQYLLANNLFKKIDEARLFFLKILNASKDDLFIFTSSATESNNTVIKGLDFVEGDVILYSKADHPSIVGPIEQIAMEKKLQLKIIPLDKSGQVDIEAFNELLSKDIKLVTLSHVNNQSGAVCDIFFLSQLVKEKTSAHVHVDAAQSFIKINLKLNNFIDSLSITSHKIGGPKGVAGLYLKKGHAVKPLLLGGSQEHGFRASTQAYPLIAAFFLASKISLDKSEKAIGEITKMRTFIEDSLKKNIPKIQCPFENTSPYIFTFILPGIPSDVFLRHLETRGFYLSSTSACSSKIKGFNPTLAALNIAENYHKNVIRLSLSLDTNIESVKLLLGAIENVWADIKYLIK